MKKMTTAKSRFVGSSSLINKHFVYAKINRHTTVAKIVYRAITPDSSGVPSNALLNEDGSPILTEDGQYILVE